MFTPSQRLLGFLLSRPAEARPIFGKLLGRFPKPESIPGVDPVTKAVYEVLYGSGLCDFPTLDLRTKGKYHDHLKPLVEDGGDAEALSILFKEDKRGKLLVALSRAQDRLVSGGADPDVVEEELRNSTSVAPPEGSIDWKAYVGSSTAEMRSMVDRGVELDTGLAELDSFFSMRRSAPVVVAAPTSQGKTAFSLRIAARASNRGLRTAMLCNEDWTTIPYKLASHIYQVPLEYFTKYHLYGKQERALADGALAALSEIQNIHIFREMPFSSFESELSRIKPDLIILDYAQRYAEMYGGEGKREALGRLACDFETLLKRHSAYGILCSQIRRREQADGKPRRPSLYDLKESGEIENYASAVLMLWWPWKDAADKSRLDKSKYIISVEKDKTGQCGEVEVVFDGSTQTHRDKFSVGEANADASEDRSW